MYTYNIGLMQMPREQKHNVYIYIWIYVYLSVEKREREKEFYLPLLYYITKTVGTGETAVAEQHAATATTAAHTSFGID